tara:strand:- start:328 stop:1071 length:744 start_codon:yes stop_codon:yes gene_type:complete
MINFKRKRRAYLMPILRGIRKILNILKRYAAPTYIKNKSVYDFYKEEQIQNCYQHFKKFFKTSVLLESDKMREHAINRAKDNDTDKDFIYMEFGVFSGKSINFFSKRIDKNIYGFDSFQGLKEDWLGTSVIKGTFDLKKKIPKLNSNVVPISGWIQDTLPPFLNEKNPKINFIHMDVDTYESSKFILEKIKPNLVKGAIILFDELYNFEGWDVGEYKALTEVFKEGEYKFISFSIDTSQAAIQILSN